VDGRSGVAVDVFHVRGIPEHSGGATDSLARELLAAIRP